MTSGQKMEQVYSYNHEASMGLKWLKNNRYNYYYCKYYY